MIVLKFALDIHGPQRMNLNVFGDEADWGFLAQFHLPRCMEKEIALNS